jgi:hypothetical protein
VLLLAAAAVPAHAQSDTVVLLRTATDRGIYHYAEVFQERGRFIPFDIGHIDFDHPRQYRELWIGGGGVPIQTPKGSLVAEGFVTKALGDEANGALYLQPFLIGTYRPVQRMVTQAVYLGYVPLNEAGRAQHLLERAKAEYDAPRFKVGAGYAVFKPADAPARHKPFITATFKAGALGDFECWLQRLPGNHLAVQLRYAKAFRNYLSSGRALGHLINTRQARTDFLPYSGSSSYVPDN